MAQTEKPHARTASIDQRTSWASSWRKLFGKDDSNAVSATPAQDDVQRPGLARRLSRKVVPGLPRPGTFKRQQSELRDRLEPTKLNPEERRAVSVDRRHASGRDSSTAVIPAPRLSAPEFLETTATIDAVLDDSQLSRIPTREEEAKEEFVEISKVPSNVDTHSICTAASGVIEKELEQKWILNLSMHFRDKSNREKFFVTYAETPTHWRRVTISLDYRHAPEGSLEEELQQTRFQRDKSARIYEAIRESLPDIQFYDTVTNLKLQTEKDRLHVHVVEDLSEIIQYPPVKAINHLSCRRVRESDLVFDSHLSGFVYKVNYDNQIFIKKEIPGPDTVDEFLYEINALHQLSGSSSVIQFGGVVLDNHGSVVKGLLISYAEQGALIDVLYDGEGLIPWQRRERWARQIVQGLSEIHEAGFVQGDFTLSNIVIDYDDNAKIIDINRRGCPVGWEPPEVAALIDSNQRISMYIGVKSDLYQLGMVLYALATQEDEPENHRPLDLGTFPPEIPEYYLDLCRRTLNDNPRKRSQASTLLTLFPMAEETFSSNGHPIPIVVNACHSDERPYFNGHQMDPARSLGFHYPQTPDLEKPNVYDYAVTDTSTELDYPSRGRSPPARPKKEIKPYKIPLPPSSSGSEYLDTPAGCTVPYETIIENSDVTPTGDHDFPPSRNSSIGFDYLNCNPMIQALGGPGSIPKSEHLPDVQHTPPRTHSCDVSLANETAEPLTLPTQDEQLETTHEPQDTPKHTMEQQPIAAAEFPRPTEAVTTTPTEYPELAGVGMAHAAHIEIPKGDLDDELTTEMHNDRLAPNSLAATTTTTTTA